MPHYQVVEVKRKGLLGTRMTAQDLQQAINEYGHQDWILDRIVTGETAKHLVGSKDVFLLIFRQEYEPPAPEIQEPGSQLSE